MGPGELDQGGETGPDLNGARGTGLGPDRVGELD